MQEKSITELRKEAGMTQAAFAEFVGCSIKTVQTWDQGRHPCMPYVKGLIEYKLRAEKKI